MVGWGAMWSVCYGGGIRGEDDCGCASGMLLKKKVLAGGVIQDLPKFSVFTSNGLTVVLWRSAVAC